MERLAPTRAHALKIWWAVTWRTALPLLAIQFILAIALGFFGQMTGSGPETRIALRAFITLAVFVIGIVLYIEMLYRILNKRFKDFEIALIPPQG